MQEFDIFVLLHAVVIDTFVLHVVSRQSQTSITTIKECCHVYARLVSSLETAKALWLASEPY